MQEREQSAGPGAEPEVRQEPRGGDGIAQLREILFGSVLQELQRRIARTDAQHVAREHDLKHEARRRVEIVESHLQRELAALADRVEREVTETSEALRTVSREQREASSALEHRIAKLEEMVAQAQRRLRQELLDQAKAFLDELETLRLELSSTLDRRLTRLERDLELGAASDEGSTEP
ncbi:MAG: hypothetical protein M5U28_38430 [Sandaracinaceae bacterium]|nr:hypothetical protein [Sandaracinaceae bacterium]